MLVEQVSEQKRDFARGPYSALVDGQPIGMPQQRVPGTIRMRCG